MDELIKAASSGDFDSVVRLIENGFTGSLESALHAACFSKSFEIMEYLIYKGADPNISNIDGVTPLYVAASKGDFDIVVHLIESGASVNSQTLSGKSPLYASCLSHNIEIIEFLLSKGADPNVCTNEGVSPLMASCFNNCMCMGKVLLDYGADINLKDVHGLTTLNMVCMYNPSLVPDLLKKGADPNICSEDNVYPLHTLAMNASSGDSVDVIRVLKMHGADLDCATLNGMTPLMIFSNRDCLDHVECMLEMNANINMQNHLGMTALHFACYNKQVDMTCLLLDYGADQSLRNQKRMTALEHAQLGRLDVREIERCFKESSVSDECFCMTPRRSPLIHCTKCKEGSYHQTCIKRWVASGKKAHCMFCNTHLPGMNDLEDSIHLILKYINEEFLESLQ